MILPLVVGCAIGAVANANPSADGGAAAKGGAPVHAESPAAHAVPPPPSPSPAATTAATKKMDWEKMSMAQRKAYMKATVLPEMKKVFVAFDAKKYQDMTCQTCHGDKATDTKFRMPNPQLPKLPPPTDQPGFMALMQQHPEMAKFMGSEVKPKMAALLGLPEAGPNKPKGFSCYWCHAKASATDPAKGAPAKVPAATGAKDPKGW